MFISTFRGGGGVFTPAGTASDELSNTCADCQNSLIVPSNEKLPPLLRDARAADLNNNPKRKVLERFSGAKIFIFSM